LPPLPTAGPAAEQVPGRLYSFTMVHVGPAGMPVPYVLGWVETDAGRVFARVTGQPSLDGAGYLKRVDGEGWWFECAR